MPFPSAPITSIKPSHLDNTRPPTGAFGSYEAEVTATWIAVFCKDRNNDEWAPFTLARLQAYDNEECDRMRKPRGTFNFHGLDRNGYINITAGVVSVTLRFIDRYHDRRPARR